MAKPTLSKMPTAEEISLLKNNPENVRGGKAVVGFCRIHEHGKTAKNFFVLEDGEQIMEDDTGKKLSKWD